MNVECRVLNVRVSNVEHRKLIESVDQFDNPLDMIGGFARIGD